MAAFDPAGGRAVPQCRLTASAERREPRVDGRYLPLRSGTLAYYRDAGGRVVVQHRRRRIVVPDGATCEARWIWALRRLTFEHGGRRLGRLWLLDAPGRWQGPLLLRLWDFTFIMPEHYDLVLEIEESTNRARPSV